MRSLRPALLALALALAPSAALRATGPAFGFVPTLQSDSAENLQLHWSGKAGKRYVVESSTDLNNWTATRAPLRGTGAPLVSIVHTAGNAEPSKFWRILESDPIAAPAWQLVPLRTAAQKAAGFAGGETGQMAFALTLAPSQPNRMALGIDTAGVYLSEDAGAHWEFRRTGLFANGVQSVAFDPVNADTLFAAGTLSSTTTSNATADGIYRSTDAAKSWQRVYSAAYLRDTAQNQYFVFTNPTGGVSRTILAVTHQYGSSPGGIVRSLDGGDTWAPYPGTGGPSAGLHRALLRHQITGTLWLAGNFGVYRSDDTGATWIRCLADPVSGIALHPDNPAIVYVGPDSGGVLRTDDGGTTWVSKNKGLPYNSNASRYYTFTSLSRGPTSLFASPHCWGGSIPVSANDGDTWTLHSFEAAFYEGRYFGEPVLAHPTEGNTAWYMSSLHVTHDGGLTWRYTGADLSGSRRSGRSSIAVRPGEPDKMMFFHTDFCASLTTDGGDTWSYRPKNPNPKSASAGACDPHGPTIIAGIGSWETRTLYRTVDDGLTWSLVRQNGAELPAAGFEAIFWRSRAPVVYACDWRSERTGVDDSWEPMEHPVRAMFPGNGDIVYSFSNSSQTGNRHSYVYKSVDRGRHWSVVGTLPEGNQGLTDIDVDPVDENRLYASCGWGVFVYDGNKWTRYADAAGLVRNHFGLIDMRFIAADPTRPGVVYIGERNNYAGVGSGVFRSLDYGVTWTNLNLNLGPELSIWGLTVTPTGEVWLGTDHGNFRLRE